MCKKTEVVISKSDKPGKKLKAAIDGRTTVHFGQSGASAMTQHKDPDRKNHILTDIRNAKIGHNLV